MVDDDAGVQMHHFLPERVQVEHRVVTAQITLQLVTVGIWLQTREKGTEMLALNLFGILML